MLEKNSEIGALVSALFGSERAGLCSDVELDEAEERLAVQLPSTLRNFYRDVGYLGPSGQAHESLLAPNQFQLRKGSLVFCVENQGVNLWGILVADLAFDDPPVVRAYNEETLEWERDHDRLSDFLITFTYWQAVNGGLPNVAIKLNASASAFGVVEERWPEIKLGPNNWRVRFFRSNDGIISLVGEDQIQAAASTATGLRKIAELIGTDWDYDEYDGEQG
jgi:hypothetical protein